MQAFAASKPIKARIYRSGCFVTRTATVTVEEGENRIVIGGIGAGADRTTLRLKMPAGMRLNRIDLIDSPLASEKVSEDDAVASKRADVESLKKKIENRELARSMWRNIATSDQPTFSDDAIELVTALPSKIDTLDAELVQLRTRLEHAEDALEALLKEAAGMGDDAFAAYARFAAADIIAPTAGTYPLELEYWDPQASWTPSYAIAVDSLEAPLLLNLRAEVSQRTGEDWEAIALELFTGDPATMSSAPTVRPRYLEFQAPIRAKAKAIMGGFARSDSPMALEDIMVDGAEPLEAMSAPQAAMSEHVTMRSNAPAGTWAVKSGGAGVFIDLTHEELAVDYKLSAIPEDDPGVYIAATLREGQAVELVECMASVSLGETYMGDVEVTPDTLSAEEPLSLGRDERITAARKLIERKTSQPLLSSAKRIELTYEFEVTNRRSTPATVEVIGLVPVSREDEIEVEVLHDAGGARNEETGEVRWSLAVPAGAAATTRLSYAISHPKKRAIVERQDAMRPPALFRDFSTSVYCMTCGTRVTGQKYCPQCGSRVAY